MKSNVKKWKEPWKKKEPGFRLSKKARDDKLHFQNQRAQMERISKLKVKIFYNKNMFLPPGQFKSFTIRTNICFRVDEFEKRMAAAFPELKWEES